MQTVRAFDLANARAKAAQTRPPYDAIRRSLCKHNDWPWGEVKESSVSSSRTGGEDMAVGTGPALPRPDG
jgi:hypothetical protein